MSPAENSQDEPKPFHKKGPKSSMPWWRAYAGIPHHPIWRLVARRSRQPVTAALAVGISLIDHASAAKDRGDVSGFDVAMCAAALDLEDEAVSDIVAAFHATGWITEGRLSSWEERQVVQEDSTNAERQQRYRDRQTAKRVNVTASNGAVTPINDREEKSEIRREVEASSLKESSLRESRAAFDRFWLAYPNKVGKTVAEKAFSKELLCLKGDPSQIMAGLERYKASKPADRQWMNPATFLNQRRFEDAPAEPLVRPPAGVPNWAMSRAKGEERLARSLMAGRSF